MQYDMSLEVGQKVRVLTMNLHIAVRHLLSGNVIDSDAKSLLHCSLPCSTGEVSTECPFQEYLFFTLLETQS